MADRLTLLIPGDQVAQAITMPEAVEVVEQAFRAYGEGRAQMPPKSYLHFDRGDLRCMPAYLPDLGLAVVKNVSVHPGNRDIPAVMATVTVFDPDTGFPLAIMDGTYLTALRTGAAGGIAARYMARPDSRVVCLVGAGRQAQTQLAALLVTMRNIRRVCVCDADPQRARQFAQWVAQAYGLDASEQPLEAGVRGADIVVTATPARAPVVKSEFVRPGTHINAIGADAPGKQELEVGILQAAKVVVDNWPQASHGGEINVAVTRGLLKREDIWADLGEVVTGRKKGRQGPGDVTVFDSTGLAIQDCACAAHVYRRLTSGAAGQLRTISFLSGP
jgi:alanine dehydrogenase